CPPSAGRISASWSNPSAGASPGASPYRRGLNTTSTAWKGSAARARIVPDRCDRSVRSGEGTHSDRPVRVELPALEGSVLPRGLEAIRPIGLRGGALRNRRDQSELSGHDARVRNTA